MALFLAGCSTASLEQSLDPGINGNKTNGDATAMVLEDLGPAPEWQNETWLNIDQPLYLQDLRGKVVLLDMWTFG